MKRDDTSLRPRDFELPAIRFVCQPPKRNRENARHFMFTHAKDSWPLQYADYRRHPEIRDGDKVCQPAKYFYIIGLEAYLFICFAQGCLFGCGFAFVTRTARE